jgi:hypothetical protein
VGFNKPAERGSAGFFILIHYRVAPVYNAAKLTFFAFLQKNDAQKKGCYQNQVQPFYHKPTTP